jgi:cytochrome c5
MSENEKNPTVTFAVLLLGMVVFTILIAVGSTMLATFADPGEVSVQAKEVIARRTAPMGTVRVSDNDPMPAASAGAEPSTAVQTTEQIVSTTCGGCHTSGVMNAPKIGVAADWKPRVAQGMPTLVKHAIEGFKGMPPKGGATSLSDKQIKEAVEEMLKKSGG